MPSKRVLGNDPFKKGAGSPEKKETKKTSTSSTKRQSTAKKTGTSSSPSKKKSGSKPATKKATPAKKPIKKTSAGKSTTTKKRSATKTVTPPKVKPAPPVKMENAPEPPTPVIPLQTPREKDGGRKSAPVPKAAEQKPQRRDPLASSSAINNLGGEGDEFGYDPKLERKYKWLLNTLYRYLWRVKVDGVENIPNDGRVILVANHAGVLPFDSLMIREAVLRDHPAQRQVRPLIEDFIYYCPYLGTFMSRMGAVRAHQENAQRLLRAKQVILVFPEGIKGIEKSYRKRYQLQRFGRGGFIKLALSTGSRIVPVSVIGSEETHPVIANFPQLARMLQLPYAPLTPLFPFLGPLGATPLPAKWSIRFGKPISFDEHDPKDIEDRRLIKPLADKVRGRIQNMLDMQLAERRSIWFG